MSSGLSTNGNNTANVTVSSHSVQNISSVTGNNTIDIFGQSKDAQTMINVFKIFILIILKYKYII